MVGQPDERPVHRAYFLLIIFFTYFYVSITFNLKGYQIWIQKWLASPTSDLYIGPTSC